MIKIFDSELRKSNPQKSVKKYSKLKINKIILIILLIILPLSQSQNQESPEDSIKKLESYIPNVQDFQNLDSSEKSDLWEMSKTGGAEARITRNVLVYKLAEKISADRLRDYKYERLLAGGVEGTKIERMKGFGDPSLKWSDSEKGKNIIGDGKVWLNLEDIPINVNEIEYKDNKFILRTKEKAELVIEPNTINNRGELKLSINDEEQIISLQDIIVSGKNGKVFLREGDGFKIEGDSELFIKGFKFKRGAVSGPSFVKITENGFVIQGVDFEFENFLKRTATDGKTIIPFGGFKNLMKGDKYLEIFEDPKKILDYLSSDIPLDSVVREISFNDRGLKDIFIPPPGRFGPGSYVKEEASFGQTGIRFNEEGNIIAFKKGDEWIPLSHADIDKVYRQSSDFVKELIDKARIGEQISYKELRDKFYGDPILKSGGREIKEDSYQDNFLIINGDNLIVGGENKNGQGEITLLRDLNSLKGINAIGITINNGERKLVLDGTELGKDTIEGPFPISIKDITLIKDNRAGISWKVENGLLTDSDRVVAGREVVKGPLGSYVDVHVDLDKEDYQSKVKPAVESSTFSPGEALVDSMLDSKFSLDFDLNIPKLPIEISGDKIRELVEGQLFSLLDRQLSRPIEALDNEVLRQETIDSIKELIRYSVKDVDKVNPGKISIGFRNNLITRTETITPIPIGPTIPQPYTETITERGDPSLIISLPGQQTREIELRGNEALLVNDLLEGSLRVPERTKYATTVPYLPYREETRYWPPRQLYDMWYYNLGKNTRVSGLKDREFRISIIKNYTKEK